MRSFLIFLISIYFFLFTNLLGNENFPLRLIKYKYALEVPDKLDIKIRGKNYIKYLKQIKQTSQKDNLNSRVINSTNKKWVNSEIKINQDNVTKIKIKIHGDWNDHISFPYSSLKVKTKKKKYFHQLKEFILFKPETRNYNAEIFSTIFLQELGFLAPYTKEIKLKINENNPQTYLLQEKVNKNFLERSGLREGPIIEYDERHRWNSVKRGDDLTNIKYANIFKFDNENFLENPDVDPINDNKLFMVLSALSNSADLKNLSSKENILFEVALSLLSACHGLIDHNRKFYYDGISEKFVPIYYDGMAFESDTTFCENQRLSKNSEFFLKQNLFFFEKKIQDLLFKEKIKDKFDKLTLNNIEFENYWSSLSSNFSKFREIVSNNQNIDNKKNENKPDNKDNLSLLLTKYPLIYYYEENEKYFECYKVNNLNYKNSDLISNNGEVVNLVSDSFCKDIKKNKFVKFLRNKIFYTPRNDKDLQIYPTYLSKKNKPSIKKVFLDISNNYEKINLKDNIIYFLYASKQNQIDNINLFSNLGGNTAVIFFGKLPNIKSIVYNENNSTAYINTKLQKFNITGCVNFYHVDAKIDKIKINNSSCEDGINIVNSDINFNEIVINQAISDGIDMDFSTVKIENIISRKSSGDCLDLSFGNYVFQKVIAKECVDKGISIGENSKVFLNVVEVSKNNIGIAIKDSSFAKIKTIDVDFENNTCLSLYNKKPEFSDGKLFYENINQKCLDNSQFSKKSIIKKMKINEEN